MNIFTSGSHSDSVAFPSCAPIAPRLRDPHSLAKSFLLTLSNGLPPLKSRKNVPFPYGNYPLLAAQRAWRGAQRVIRIEFLHICLAAKTAPPVVTRIHGRCELGLARSKGEVIRGIYAGHPKLRLGGRLARRNLGIIWRFVALVFVAALPAAAQSFRVQCPTTTITHPNVVTSVTGEPAYNGPTPVQYADGWRPNWNFRRFRHSTTTTANGAIKCQQVSGGDGYSTMANGIQTFMFSSSGPCPAWPTSRPDFRARNSRTSSISPSAT